MTHNKISSNELKERQRKALLRLQFYSFIKKLEDRVKIENLKNELREAK
jgi:hypothetical protein